jgi:hypothetical protein
MTNVDFSKTGMENYDMYNFGIGENTDYSSINAGKIIIDENELTKAADKTPEEMTRYKGNLVLSKFLANTIMKSLATNDSSMKNEIAAIKNTSDIIAKYIPQFSKGIDTAGTDALSNIILVLREAAENHITNFGNVISEKIVKPVALSSIKALIFLVIFVIISIILSFLVRALGFVNHIPVVGTLNKVLGFILGFTEAVIMILVFSALLGFVITITGNEIIAFNTITIEKTYLFKYFYNLMF